MGAVGSEGEKERKGGGGGVEYIVLFFLRALWILRIIQGFNVISAEGGGKGGGGVRNEEMVRPETCRV